MGSLHRKTEQREASKAVKKWGSEFGRPYGCLDLLSDGKSLTSLRRRVT